VKAMYAIALAPWLLIAVIGPVPFLAGCIVSGALVIGVAGWLVDGDHVTIEEDK